MTVIKVQTTFAKGKEKWADVDSQYPFATAVIDPDWPYTVAPGVEDKEKAEGKGKLSGYTRNRDAKQNTYQRGVKTKPMSIEELKQLPVGKLVGGYVLMWTVGPFLIGSGGVDGTASEIMRAWGFEPSTIFTWAKYDLENKHGYGGVGFWSLGNAEFCIVGKRKEKGWPSIRTGRSSLIIAPKGEHSRKPDDIDILCEERFPRPYLKIFGRRLRPGWTVLGNEVPGHDGEDIRDAMTRVGAPDEGTPDWMLGK